MSRVSVSNLIRKFSEEGLVSQGVLPLRGAGPQQRVQVHAVHQKIGGRVGTDDPDSGPAHSLLPDQVAPLHKAQRPLYTVRIPFLLIVFCDLRMICCYCSIKRENKL